MNFRRKTVVAILALSFLFSMPGTHQVTTATEVTVHTGTNLKQDFNPPHIFPEKELYEIEEGESLIISINVIFPSSSGGCIETVAYDALTPKPDFATITQTFQREFKKPGSNDPYIHQMSLLVLSPQRGDAGKHEIKIREKLCPQSEGTILSFKVNVNRLGPPLRSR